MVKTILVTGSNCLVGRNCGKPFLNDGYEVYGSENNVRSVYFGSEANTRVGKSATCYLPGVVVGGI
jgi:nucleoside-diphosphate-sugar epimerase